MNKLFNSAVRVKILALLYGMECCEFGYLKERLKLTDGNLEHHLNKLENYELITQKKTVIRNKLKTEVKITKKGKDEFKNYLEEILRLSKSE
ncbi:transcriptional regulator [Methanothermococcus okinawensis]|nr:transcriptional regulator [Methanothermococcus okinawensis]